MCGIVGYVGGAQAKDILFSGLRRLEYRGYDSAGICIVDDGGLECIRVVGNLDAMEDVIKDMELRGTTGIAHTRWATHGAPTETNAHPHLDCKQDIAIVHNGIIENFSKLRSDLKERGHVFRSMTDSETLAHLIEECYQGDLEQALRECLEQVEGSFAVVAVHRANPDVIVGARRDSPLAVGVSDGATFIASGVPAFLASTRNVLFLEDDEIVTASESGARITTMKGEPVEREPIEIDWDLDAAEKGGYEDFMLKEIHEQPKAVEDTMADKFDAAGVVCLESLGLDSQAARDMRRVIVVACGTSYHAGLLGRYLIEHWAEVPAEIEIASEFRTRTLIVGPTDTVLAISQSGETMDTLVGVREARRLGAKIIAVVNVVGSLMTRESDGAIYTHAGPEVGVAATKTFTAQMVAMYLLALYLGRLRGTIGEHECRQAVDELHAIPAKMEQVLTRTDTVDAIARKFYENEDFLFLGRNVGYPIAMEGALKLKEISYIHAEGYPAGEMKHGPIALLDPTVPVVAVAPSDGVYEKMVNNIEEVKARNAPVIGVATDGNREMAEICEDVLWIPETLELLYPLLTVLPLQLLAYRIAKLRGCNVDQPRNLAKTVTVE
jgi:glucosamine--fructose-6-phosphate aminotransferase (isomerizing)